MKKIFLSLLALLTSAASLTAQDIEKCEPMKTPAVTFCRYLTPEYTYKFYFLAADSTKVFPQDIETLDVRLDPSDLKLLQKEVETFPSVTDHNVEFHDYCFILSLYEDGKYGAVDLLGNLIAPFKFKTPEKLLTNKEFLKQKQTFLTLNKAKYEKRIAELADIKDRKDRQVDFDAFLNTFNEYRSSDFDEYQPFFRGSAKLRRVYDRNNNRWGIIDEFGNWLIPCEYDEIFLLQKDRANEDDGTDELPEDYEKGQPYNFLFPVKTSKYGNYYQFVDFMNNVVRNDRRMVQVLDTLNRSSQPNGGNNCYIVRYSDSNEAYYIPKSARDISLNDFVAYYLNLNLNKVWMNVHVNFEDEQQFQERTSGRLDELEKAYLANCAVRLYANLFGKRSTFVLKQGIDNKNSTILFETKDGWQLPLQIPQAKHIAFRKAWNKDEIKITNIKFDFVDKGYDFKSWELEMPTGESFTGTSKMECNIPGTRFQGNKLITFISTKDGKEEKVEKLSDVDTGLPAFNGDESTMADTYVLIVSNEKYTNVPDVSYAIHDGEIFEKYCTRTLGIPASNITRITNAGFNPMRSAINQLNRKQKNLGKPIDIIFYYAGHGVPDPQTKKAYILPVDADPTIIADTGYELQEIYNKLKSDVGRVTCFLDACFSGANLDDPNAADSKHRGLAVAPSDAYPEGRMVVFSASQGAQRSFPYEEKGHGLFTYYLLKKLKDTGGKVNYKDLGEYLRTEVVRQTTLRGGEEQTPTTESPLPQSVWQKWTFAPEQNIFAPTDNGNGTPAGTGNAGSGQSKSTPAGTSTQTHVESDGTVVNNRVISLGSGNGKF